jgi:HEPN domain-containing protein
MTEFTKTKMHFALAMLGTLFALHSLLNEFENWTFHWLDYEVKLIYVYALIGGLLAFTVYSYALALLTERPSSRWERLGNYTYALAILTVPLYGFLYLSKFLAEYFGEAHVQITAPASAAVLAGLWLLVGLVLRRRLGIKDRQAKVEQLADQEIAALDRAPELFDQHHYDLAVIEAWKAIEARLRRVLLLRGYLRRFDNTQKMVDVAARAGLIPEASRKLLQEVRKQWNIAVSTEPLTREAAEAALTAARQILATIPVESGPELARHAV